MLLKLEVFKYATSLDLNMGYYHIQLSKNESKLCAIILPWGKYCYKLLPMRVNNYPDIFQHNMNDLFHVFEFIRAYMDYPLILTKLYWTDYVQRLELTKNKLKEKGLECNT